MRSKVFMFKPSSPQFSACGLLLALATLSSVLLSASPARAAGFFLPTRGVASTGRAAASVAPHSADLDALWYNPAGLTLLEERALLVDFALLGSQVTFSRAPRQMSDGSTRTYDPVQNQAPPNAIPQVLVGGPTPLPGLYWAAGAYTPYAPAYRYPVDGAQRYVLVDNTGSALGYLHLAVGYQINETLSVGLGLQNFMGLFRVVSTGSGYAGMFGDPEDPDLDILAESTVSSFFAPTANLGATWRPHRQWTLGLSLQLPAILRDKNATIDTRMPSHPAYDNARASGNKASITVPFPLHARLGVRHATERFNVELALVYQRWSTLNEIEVSPDEVEIQGVPGIGAMPVAPFVLPQRFRDSLSVHLGGEYRLSPRFLARGGYAFERGAVPDETYSVFALDPDKHLVTLGGGVALSPRLHLDLSAAAIIMPTRTITTSEVRQINPSDEHDEITLVVGNGTYEHWGYIAGLSARYLF
ncbi:OmpP1/FadL family transporter [Lujinxingia litoralis]|nr:outer membrane protein transport protein [Lujinxingia litoralis]